MVVGDVVLTNHCLLTIDYDVVLAYGCWRCGVGLCLFAMWLIMMWYWLMVAGDVVLAYVCWFMAVGDVVLINFCSVMDQKRAVRIEWAFIWAMPKNSGGT